MDRVVNIDYNPNREPEFSAHTHSAQSDKDSLWDTANFSASDELPEEENHEFRQQSSYRLDPHNPFKSRFQSVLPFDPDIDPYVVDHKDRSMAFSSLDEEAQLGNQGLQNQRKVTFRPRSPLEMESPLHNFEGKPLRHMKEGKSGFVAFTDDGGVLFTPSASRSTHTTFDPGLEGPQDEAYHRFERQDTEYFQVIPEVQNDGGHLDQLLDLFDEVQDGLVSRDELYRALSRSAQSNGVRLNDDVIEDLVDLIMEEADVDKNGCIEVLELAHILYGPSAGTPGPGQLIRMATGRHPAFSGRSHSLQQTSKTLDPMDQMPEHPQGSDVVKGLVLSQRFRQEAVFFLSNNWKSTVAVLLWLAVNATLVVCRFFYMRHTESHKVMGDWLGVAKAGSTLVKFNAGVLVFVVCRWTMTLLRGTFLRYFIPFDDYLIFHKLAVLTILIGAAVHTVAITCGAYVRIVEAPRKKYVAHLGALYGPKQPNYHEILVMFNSLTGYGLWAVLIMICTFSTEASRKFLASHRLTKPLSTFDAFWWCHLSMFPTFFVLILYHGSHTKFPHFPDADNWKYVVGPLCIYVVEKLHKMLFTRIKHRALDVTQVEILPGNVLCLHLSNPPFKFQSGMYVFVQCPGVSRFEWHPFSITSSPSDFELTVHIRAGGDWTKAMLEYWKEEKRKGENFGAVTSDGEIIVVTGIDRPITKFRYPRVLIDGPHGAPVQDYEHFRVIMLVGAGIGVTPIASVVRDVLHKSKYRRKYPSFNVEKVHFFWTTREQQSFEWFSGLMAQAAEEDKAGVVDMHNYLTSAYGDDDPRSFLLKAARDKFHAKTGHDIITNTKAKIATHFSRPNWNAIFSKIASHYPSVVIGVFFCGPRALQLELLKNCKRYTLERNNGTIFIFHHENF